MEIIIRWLIGKCSRLVAANGRGGNAEGRNGLKPLELCVMKIGSSENGKRPAEFLLYLAGYRRDQLDVIKHRMQ